MDNICRLCCSTKFVNNDIFDEENALYLKMSLYLPIKVFRTDQLPQRVCDKCSCKVNDFYQFCNETIEVQNRLRSLLQTSSIISHIHQEHDSVDLTIIKESSSPLPSEHCDQATQTDHTPQAPEITKLKTEPELEISIVKQEDDSFLDDNVDSASSSSDDTYLINLKQRKSSLVPQNGKTSKVVKRKHKVTWDPPSGTTISRLPVSLLDVKPKEELDEAELYNCCICLTQCYGRRTIIQHYKAHSSDVPRALPAAPAEPGLDPARCMRCDKKVPAREWRAHVLRHFERDRRPLRCALCERTYRDHKLIFKHGLTHNYDPGAASGEPEVKRFLCDLCPQAFVHMRSLLAHRAGAHPEALGRPLALRCGVCERQFAHLNSLRRHLRACVRSLLAHRAGAHPEALGRPLALRCGVCERQFAHLNSLRRHLRAHTGERNFLCNVCGKSLSSREHLKFHIRIHTGYKPNVCKTCGKGFVKKCNLMLHERVHSGEKPYVCSACGKAFSQRSTLVIHERYHSGARPYSCALCGKGFVAKGLLTMHLKTTCM